MLSGKTLKNAREQAGESQIEFAKRLGVHQSVLSRLERGRRLPKGAVRLLIERVLEDLDKAREAAE